MTIEGVLICKMELFSIGRQGTSIEGVVAHL